MVGKHYGHDVRGFCVLLIEGIAGICKGKKGTMIVSERRRSGCAIKHEKRMVGGPMTGDIGMRLDLGSTDGYQDGLG
jgi:hypothetical protein